MDRDSQEYKDRKQEIVELAAKIDDLRAAVLKAHAVVEGALGDFIQASAYQPQHLKLEYANFHGKGSIAQSLCRDEGSDPLWAVVWALNQLRNKVAHNAPPDVIKEKLKALRDAYMKTVSGQRAEEAKNYSDGKLLQEAPGCHEYAARPIGVALKFRSTAGPIRPQREELHP